MSIGDLLLLAWPVLVPLGILLLLTLVRRRYADQSDVDATLTPQPYRCLVCKVWTRDPDHVERAHDDDQVEAAIRAARTHGFTLPRDSAGPGAPGASHDESRPARPRAGGTT